MAEPSVTGSTRTEAGSPQGRAAVFAWIAVVAVLFVMLFGVIWYRSWYKQPAAPSARFVVQGTAEHEGMLITITGKRLAEPLQATIRKEDEYVAAFSLPAGSYTIRITLDGRLYFEQRAFHLHDYHLAHLPLKAIDDARRKAASRPA